jgi:hypothetical protein
MRRWHGILYVHQKNPTLEDVLVIPKFCLDRLKEFMDTHNVNLIILFIDHLTLLCLLKLYYKIVNVDPMML